MTYLEQLLDGAAVEWKPLGEVADVSKLAGFEFTKYVKYSDIGTIIAIRGLNVKGHLDLSDVKYMDNSNFEKLSRSKLYSGDMLFTYVGTVGNVAIVDEDDRFYLAPNVCRIRFTNGNILPRFMFYYFQTSRFRREQMGFYMEKSTMQNLTMGNIRKFLIPLPPLRVQEQIVAILDKFTALIEALETELALRTQQYTYYRNKLLRFGANDPNVQWKPLGEVAELKRGRVISKKYIEENAGQYPVYSSQTLNNGEIGRIQTFDFDCETVTWTTDGVYAGTVFYRKGKFSITNICGMITILDTQCLNYQFLFFWLSIEARKHVNPSMGNAKVMNHQMAKILIPLPPLPVQEQIVAILDKFHTLVHSISEGLPAEIALRRRQYEYYRNRLLRFPRS
ncbi:MAG: restriction endonuclease subunit S [Bacteroides sp.]